VPFLLPKPGLKVLPVKNISASKHPRQKMKTDLERAEKIDAI